MMLFFQHSSDVHDVRIYLKSIIKLYSIYSVKIMLKQLIDWNALFETRNFAVVDFINSLKLKLGLDFSNIKSGFKWLQKIQNYIYWIDEWPSGAEVYKS